MNLLRAHSLEYAVLKQFLQVLLQVVQLLFLFLYQILNFAVPCPFTAYPFVAWFVLPTLRELDNLPHHAASSSSVPSTLHARNGSQRASLAAFARSAKLVIRI